MIFFQWGGNLSEMRYLTSAVAELTRQKMVWISGPRRVGKTTLSKHWLKGKSRRYLDWDIQEDRRRILQPSFTSLLHEHALVLDEIHKYPKWKSWVKGLYDKLSAQMEIVVTGSARLNVFRRGGDSLLGRYELLRLHPFSIGELTRGE